LDLPATDDTPLIRIDYSDDAVWLEMIQMIQKPSSDGFLAYVQTVDDVRFTGVTDDVLKKVYAKHHAIVIIVDTYSINEPSHTLRCMDLQSGQSLRVVPSALWSIQNNLSLANMDFEEFVRAADDDGVFRGF
jgi:hypothetical protein